MTASTAPSDLFSAPAPNISRDTRALRDAWMQSYSQHAIIGKIFKPDGSLYDNGKTPSEWLLHFKILQSDARMLDSVQLRALWIDLAKKYNTAASYHSNLTLAADSLEQQLEELESKFIQAEISKYSSGGEYWDDLTKKLSQKRPAAATLQDIARAQTSDTRRALGMLKREASFFKNCMDNLETQRRCLKDYAELLNLDPATRGLV